MLLLQFLDGGDEIILVNWPNDKHIICNNNDIPVKIPSHPYVLVNRSILCNCGIEVDNHHLLDLIASCDKNITKLTNVFHYQSSIHKLPGCTSKFDRTINFN